MHRIHRDREHRALLPFERVTLGVALHPDLGGAATFHDEEDFFVHVLLGIECAGPRDFDDVAAPFRFGAVELDVGAASARALPRFERKVMRALEAEAAET